MKQIYNKSQQELEINFKPVTHIIFDCDGLLLGADFLVKHFYSHGIPCCVGSSSSTSTMKRKSQNHQDIFKLFEHVVTADSAPEMKGKPAPDIFLVCAKKFKNSPTPNNCLVFEDAPAGVTAARAAGMQVVMVPDRNLDPSLTKEATQVVSSLYDFIPEQFGLPGYCSCSM